MEIELDKLKIADRIAEELAPKFVSEHFELEDLKQEAWVHLLGFLSREGMAHDYETLYRHTKNRLIGWKRQFFRRDFLTGKLVYTG